MPYQQPYVDPNTGATFPQSYVRVGQPQVDFGSNRVSFNAARYASQACYSLGFHPIQSVDVAVAGVPYASWFATPIGAALASFNGMLATTADSYIGSLVTLSGATPVS